MTERVILYSCFHYFVIFVMLLRIVYVEQECDVWLMDSVVVVRV